MSNDLDKLLKYAGIIFLVISFLSLAIGAIGFCVAFIIPAAIAACCMGFGTSLGLTGIACEIVSCLPNSINESTLARYGNMIPINESLDNKETPPPPLHSAAFNGDTTTIRNCIEKDNIPVNQVDDTASKWTPLHYAVNSRQIESVRTLLEYGANPLIQDKIGQTPWKYAKDYLETNQNDQDYKHCEEIFELLKNAKVAIPSNPNVSSQLHNNTDQMR